MGWDEEFEVYFDVDLAELVRDWSKLTEEQAGVQVTIGFNMMDAPEGVIISVGSGAADKALERKIDPYLMMQAVDREFEAEEDRMKQEFDEGMAELRLSAMEYYD